MPQVAHEVAPAESSLGVVIPLPVREMKFDLKAWRSSRLGLMKQRSEYKSLPPIVRRLVDHLVRVHESPDEGITVAQSNPKLLAKFGCTDRTIRTYLKVAVTSGVLTCAPRYRGLGTKGGRMSNAYRLNEALLSPEQTTNRTVTVPPTFPVTVPRKYVSGRTDRSSLREHVEAHYVRSAKDEKQESPVRPAPTDAGIPQDVEGAKRPAPSTCTTIPDTTIASLHELQTKYVEAFRRRHGREPTSIPSNRMTLIEQTRNPIPW